jgi:hypothetical protein
MRLRLGRRTGGSSRLGSRRLTASLSGSEDGRRRRPGRSLFAYRAWQSSVSPSHGERFRARQRDRPGLGCQDDRLHDCKMATVCSRSPAPRVVSADRAGSRTRSVWVASRSVEMVSWCPLVRALLRPGVSHWCKRRARCPMTAGRRSRPAGVSPHLPEQALMAVESVLSWSSRGAIETGQFCLGLWSGPTCHVQRDVDWLGRR